MVGYFNKIQNARDKGILSKDCLNHLMVQHDDFCPMMSGGSICVCNPDVTILVGKEIFVVNDDGTIQIKQRQ